MNESKRVVNIAEHEHFADYAELQQVPEEPRWNVKLCMLGTALLASAIWGLIWFLFSMIR